jgi:hypothetical protein
MARVQSEPQRPRRTGMTVPATPRTDPAALTGRIAYEVDGDI